MRRIVFPQVGAEPEGAPPSLTRFAWLSIAAAVLTIGLKSGAYLLTGSVGLLSDAAESGVNLVAAVVALVALHVAARAPDENHNFGHGKAEYFSAGIEGLMIFVAAGFIWSPRWGVFCIRPRSRASGWAWRSRPWPPQ